MAIRENLVESAVKFLQDPSVASSPIENRIAFLQSKNLTKEEVDAALARASGAEAPPPAQQAVAAPPSSPYPVQQYGGYQQPPPYGWQQQQQQQPPVPKRDWRDWFIMATVVGGVGFGLYTLTKRYITPLIAPPTPEKLEQDKQQIDEKFDRAFALIDQLSADTTELKNAEQARTERLDKALGDLETVISDLKTANRRREDDAQRTRDDVQGLKDAIPRAMNAQKDMTETRLRDLNSELKSLKTLMTQRMTSSGGPPASPAVGAASSGTGYVRPSVSTAPPSAAVTPQPVPGDSSDGAVANGGSRAAGGESATTPGSSSATGSKQVNDYVSSLSRSSPFGSGMPAGKASIPAWQMAMATKSTASTTKPEGSSSSGAAAEKTNGTSTS